MNLFKIKIIIMVLFTYLPAKSADFWAVDCYSSVFNYASCMVTAVMSKENKLVTIKVESKDENLWTIPVAEFTDIDNPRIERMRLLYTTRKPFVKLHEIPDGEFLVVAIPYGETKEIAINKDNNNFTIYRLNDIAYFVFTNKGYVHRSRRIVNEKKDVWEIFYKEVGTKEIYDGAQEYDSDVSQELSAPSLPTKAVNK